jgi:hypothetical protein
MSSTQVAGVGETEGDAVGETDGELEGDAVGDSDGPDVGPNVGDADGDAVGDVDGFLVGLFEGNAVGVAVVGNAVGVSVLSQQFRYVEPSLVGQHSSPVLNPIAAHRVWTPQSFAGVGAAVVGTAVGDGVAAHRFSSPSPPTHLFVSQSECSRHCCPIAHVLSSVHTPPQSTSASRSSRTPLMHFLMVGEKVGEKVGAFVLSQQFKKVSSCVGQHCWPVPKPALMHRACRLQSATVVGECDGDTVGDAEGDGVGEMEGDAVGTYVFSQQGR